MSFLNNPLLVAITVGISVYLFLTIFRLYLNHKKEKFLADLYVSLVEKHELAVMTKGCNHPETLKIREEILKLDFMFDK